MNLKADSASELLQNMLRRPLMIFFSRVSNSSPFGFFNSKEPESKFSKKFLPNTVKKRSTCKITLKSDQAVNTIFKI